MELGYNPAFNKSCQALGFGSPLGCNFYEGREVVFNAWRLEETKPLKQRETLAVRSRIYIYNKLEKANKKRNATNIC
jgi:recombinational DNA repair protein (RecF pathway)